MKHRLSLYAFYVYLRDKFEDIISSMRMRRIQSIMRNFLFGVMGVCLVNLSSVKAETRYISIQDIIDLSPVAGANVLVYRATDELLSEGISTENGRYKLTQQLSDNDYLSITHPDYLPTRLTAKDLKAQYYKVFLESKTFNMDEVVFTANKFQEKKADIPFQIDIISAKSIAFQNPQTSADLLFKQGSVFIQKSQQGGGSPNLRGFEANKVLIVIDGVRMNNAIYRSGHLQNVITIDPNMVERTEVMFGPGSVMYGSDALGGVMHFYSRRPKLSSTDKPNVKINAFSRYSTANQEKTAHVDVNLGFKKWGMISSFSLSDFGDLRMGKVRQDAYPDFGKRLQYQIRENGQDVVKENDQPNLQRFSAYTQYDFNQKLLFIPNSHITHSFSLQYSTSSDIPRFDRLSQYRDGRLRYAEWNYGPQKRLMGHYQLKLFGDSTFYDQLSLTAAYQQVEESRISRNLNSDWRNHRIESLDIFSLNVDAIKELVGHHELAYGLEGIVNKVASDAFSQNILSGEITSLDTRYPDGGSQMRFLAAYFSHRWEISDRLILSDGIRFTDVFLESTFENKEFFPFSFSQIRQSSQAISGNLGLVFKPAKGWRISLLGATGFRAPNVDDVSKVFDSQPGNVVIPNPNLKPEYTYNGELTVSKQIDDWLQIELTGFYTFYDNAIVVRAANFEGKDSIKYEGVMSRVQANVNAQQAYITGFNTNLKMELGHWSFLHTLTFTYGQDLSSDLPMDHIPPVFGREELRFKTKRFEAAFNLMYNGWKRIERFSPRDLNNLEFSTPDGAPAWWTLNFHSTFALSSKLKLQLGVENIFDRHYRPYASRFSAPGRNVILALRAIL